MKTKRSLLLIIFVCTILICLSFYKKNMYNNETDNINDNNVVEKQDDSILLDMDLKSFDLEKYFMDIIPNESTKISKDELNDFIFVGDSVPLYYVMSKHINGRNLWHKEGINAESALVQPIYIAHQESGLTFVEAFEKYKPNKAIITLGMNSVATMTPEYFIKCYKTLIEDIKKVSPATILYIQSIPPVDSSLDSNDTGLTNKKINNFNYYIAKMCREMNLKFLNSAKVLKDENGQCKKGYSYLEKNNYGVHQTKEGNNEVFDYIMTHIN